ncbi:hypothetical protein HUT18_23680 [Streptomyces sp. NA04227]|nr:hypothetical protein [Streptomyces sp. NA04227]QKW04971.1 hypothetical protein HUT18_23680 [Streptomyces sp. NA04227]
MRDQLGAARFDVVDSAMLRDAGFDRVDERQVEGDILNLYYVARKAS